MDTLGNISPSARSGSPTTHHHHHNQNQNLVPSTNSKTSMSGSGESHGPGVSHSGGEVSPSSRDRTMSIAINNNPNRTAPVAVAAGSRSSSGMQLQNQQGQQQQQQNQQQRPDLLNIAPPSRLSGVSSRMNVPHTHSQSSLENQSQGPQTQSNSQNVHQPHGTQKATSNVMGHGGQQKKDRFAIAAEKQKAERERAMGRRPGGTGTGTGTGTGIGTGLGGVGPNIFPNSMNQRSSTQSGSGNEELMINRQQGHHHSGTVPGSLDLKQTQQQGQQQGHGSTGTGTTSSAFTKPTFYRGGTGLLSAMTGSVATGSATQQAMQQHQHGHLSEGNSSDAPPNNSYNMGQSQQSQQNRRGNKSNSNAVPGKAGNKDTTGNLNILSSTETGSGGLNSGTLGQSTTTQTKTGGMFDVLKQNLWGISPTPVQRKSQESLEGQSGTHGAQNKLGNTNSNNQQPQGRNSQNSQNNQEPIRNGRKQSELSSADQRQSPGQDRGGLFNNLFKKKSDISTGAGGPDLGGPSPVQASSFQKTTRETEKSHMSAGSGADSPTSDNNGRADKPSPSVPKQDRSAAPGMLYQPKNPVLAMQQKINEQSHGHHSGIRTKTRDSSGSGGTNSQTMAQPQGTQQGQGQESRHGSKTITNSAGLGSKGLARHGSKSNSTGNAAINLKTPGPGGSIQTKSLVAMGGISPTSSYNTLNTKGQSKPQAELSPANSDVEAMMNSVIERSRDITMSNQRGSGPNSRTYAALNSAGSKDRNTGTAAESGPGVNDKVSQSSQIGLVANIPNTNSQQNLLLPNNQSGPTALPFLSKRQDSMASGSVHGGGPQMGVGRQFSIAQGGPQSQQTQRTLLNSPQRGAFRNNSGREMSIMPGVFPSGTSIHSISAPNSNSPSIQNMGSQMNFLGYQGQNAQKSQSGLSSTLGVGQGWQPGQNASMIQPAHGLRMRNPNMYGSVAPGQLKAPGQSGSNARLQGPSRFKAGNLDLNMTGDIGGPGRVPSKISSDKSDRNESLTKAAKRTSSIQIMKDKAKQTNVYKMYEKIAKSMVSFKTLFVWTFFACTQGILVGCANVGFHSLVHVISHFWRDTVCQAEWDVYPGTRQLVLRMAGVLVSSIVTGFLTTYVVPECCGGGMLAVKMCLAAGSTVPLRTGIYRLLMSSVYIGFGNTLGVEAPTLHITAAVTCFVYEIFGVLFGGGYFPEWHKNTMVIIGCCTGLACAFDTPFGGIIFVIEEFLKGSSGSKNFNFLLCFSVASGVIVSRWLLNTESYFEVDLDDGGRFINQRGLWMMFSFPVGISGGLISCFFIRYCAKIKKFYLEVFETELYDPRENATQAPALTQGQEGQGEEGGQDVNGEQDNNVITDRDPDRDSPGEPASPDEETTSNQKDNANNNSKSNLVLNYQTNSIPATSQLEDPNMNDTNTVTQKPTQTQTDQDQDDHHDDQQQDQDQAQPKDETQRSKNLKGRETEHNDDYDEVNDEDNDDKSGAKNQTEENQKETGSDDIDSEQKNENENSNYQDQDNDYESRPRRHDSKTRYTTQPVDIQSAELDDISGSANARPTTLDRDSTNPLVDIKEGNHNAANQNSSSSTDQNTNSNQVDPRATSPLQTHPPNRDTNPSQILNNRDSSAVDSSAANGTTTNDNVTVTQQQTVTQGQATTSGHQATSSVNFTSDSRNSDGGADLNQATKSKETGGALSAYAHKRKTRKLQRKTEKKISERQEYDHSDGDQNQQLDANGNKIKKSAQKNNSKNSVGTSGTGSVGNPEHGEDGNQIIGHDQQQQQYAQQGYYGQDGNWYSYNYGPGTTDSDDYSISSSQLEERYVYKIPFRKLFEPQWRPFLGGVITCCLGTFYWLVTWRDAIFHVGKDDIVWMLTEDIKMMSSLFYLCIKLVCTAWCCASDASGGFFYPSLSIGASCGSIFKKLARYIYEIESEQDVMDNVIHNDRYHLITVLGMMAVFAGNTRCPLSAVVIVYEMTNVGQTRADFVFPSLVASLIGYVVSSELQASDFYETMAGITDEDSDVSEEVYMDQIAEDDAYQEDVQSALASLQSRLQDPNQSQDIMITPTTLQGPGGSFMHGHGHNNRNFSLVSRESLHLSAGGGGARRSRGRQDLLSTLAQYSQQGGPGQGQSLQNQKVSIDRISLIGSQAIDGNNNQGLQGPLSRSTTNTMLELRSVLPGIGIGNLNPNGPMMRNSYRGQQQLQGNQQIQQNAQHLPGMIETLNQLGQFDGNFEGYSHVTDGVSNSHSDEENLNNNVQTGGPVPGGPGTSTQGTVKQLGPASQRPSYNLGHGGPGTLGQQFNLHQQQQNQMNFGDKFDMQSIVSRHSLLSLNGYNEGGVSITGSQGIGSNIGQYHGGGGGGSSGNEAAMGKSGTTGGMKNVSTKKSRVPKTANERMAQQILERSEQQRRHTAGENSGVNGPGGTKDGQTSATGGIVPNRGNTTKGSFFSVLRRNLVGETGPSNNSKVRNQDFQSESESNVGSTHQQQPHGGHAPLRSESKSMTGQSIMIDNMSLMGGVGGVSVLPAVQESGNYQPLDNLNMNLKQDGVGQMPPPRRRSQNRANSSQSNLSLNLGPGPIRRISGNNQLIQPQAQSVLGGGPSVPGGPGSSESIGPGGPINIVNTTPLSPTGLISRQQSISALSGSPSSMFGIVEQPARSLGLASIHSSGNLSQGGGGHGGHGGHGHGTHGGHGPSVVVNKTQSTGLATVTKRRNTLQVKDFGIMPQANSNIGPLQALSRSGSRGTQYGGGPSLGPLAQQAQEMAQIQTLLQAQIVKQAAELQIAQQQIQQLSHSGGPGGDNQRPVRRGSGSGSPTAWAKEDSRILEESTNEET